MQNLANGKCKDFYGSNKVCFVIFKPIIKAFLMGLNELKSYYFLKFILKRKRYI